MYNISPNFNPTPLVLTSIGGQGITYEWQVGGMYPTGMFCCGYLRPKMKLSFCSWGGGSVSKHAIGQGVYPWTHTSLSSGHNLWTHHLPGHTPPLAEIPWTHTPGHTHLGRHPPKADSHKLPPPHRENH